MDVIPVVTALNLKFKRQDLHISVISPSVRLTIHEINVLTENSSSLKQLDENSVIIDGKHSLKGVEITVIENEKKKPTICHKTEGNS